MTLFTVSWVIQSHEIVKCILCLNFQDALENAWKLSAAIELHKADDWHSIEQGDLIQAIQIKSGINFQDIESNEGYFDPSGEWSVVICGLET